MFLIHRQLNRLGEIVTIKYDIQKKDVRNNAGFFLLATKDLINTGISLDWSKSTNSLILSMIEAPKEKALVLPLGLVKGLILSFDFAIGCQICQLKLANN